MVYRSLDSLFKPKSVAVIGATEDTSKFGGRIFNFLVEKGFKGKVFPVNPKRQSINNIACYSNLKDIPFSIDVAVFAIPRTKIEDILLDCVDKGVKNIIIMTSGFAELNEKGKLDQHNILKICKENNIRILGPNCLGLINYKDQITLSSTVALEDIDLQAGNIGMISQSGALMGSLVSRLNDINAQCSYVVSTGNEADIELAELIEYFVQEESIKVIGIFMETARNPRRFAKALKMASELKKPLVVLKVGRSKLGSKVARSHTDAFAGKDETYNALFNKYGVTKVFSFDELLYTVHLFSTINMPTNSSVAVLSNSGGSSSTIVDRLNDFSITLAETLPETNDKLASLFGLSKAMNPIELGMQQSNEVNVAEKALHLFDSDPNVGIILVVLSSGPRPHLPYDIINYRKGSTKPLMVLCIGGSSTKKSYEILSKHLVPVYEYMDACIMAIKHIIELHNFKQPAYHCFDYQNGDYSNKKPPDIKNLFIEHGVSFVKEETVKDLNSALEAAERIQYPVTIKIKSEIITHKSDVGGVIVGVPDEESLIKAFKKITDSLDKYQINKTLIKGFTIQETIFDAVEVLVGLSFKDEIFGPRIVIGSGGVYVELLKDIVHALVPISPEEALRLFRTTKVFKLLDGFRGSSSKDIDALCKTVSIISQLAAKLGPYYSSLEINPLLVRPKGHGVTAVDLRVIYD